MGEFRIGQKHALHSYPDHPRLGPTGPTGPSGATGPGATGPTGATGASGGLANFANFYALMPGDNPAPIAANAPVAFPNAGPLVGTGIVSNVGGTTFTLTNAGTYEVSWQVSISEAGQLGIALGGTIQPDTVVSRASGSTQLVGDTLITVGAGAVLSIINPPGNSPAETITPDAGGNNPVSATLTIKQLTP